MLLKNQDIPSDVRRKIVSDYLDGMNQNNIVDKYLISVGTLYIILSDAGIKTVEYKGKRRSLSMIPDSEKEDIVSKYKKWLLKDIYSYYNITKHTFYKLLVEKGGASIK